jgi:hypothetical protein
VFESHSGPEPARARPAASAQSPRRSIALALAIAAAWLVFVLVSAWAQPARADELAPSAPDSGGSAPGTAAPDSGGAGGGDTGGGNATGGAGDTGGTQTPTDSNPAPQPSDPSGGQPSSTPGSDAGAGAPTTGDTSGGAGGAAGAGDTSGGNGATTQPTDPASSDGGSQKDAQSKATDVGSGGDSSGTTTVAGPQTTLPTAADAADVMWVEQWAAFPLDDFGGAKPPGAAAGIPLARPFGLGIFRATRASRLEARARQAGESPKLSALGRGPLIPGGPGHGLGTFLDLFSGSGSGATLMLFGLLGVLAVTLMPRVDRTRAFWLPMATWRPSAYVPPIEQPG